MLILLHSSPSSASVAQLLTSVRKTSVASRGSNCRQATTVLVKLLLTPSSSLLFLFFFPPPLQLIAHPLSPSQSPVQRDGWGQGLGFLGFRGAEGVRARLGFRACEVSRGSRARWGGSSEREKWKGVGWVEWDTPPPYPYFLFFIFVIIYFI